MLNSCSFFYIFCEYSTVQYIQYILRKLIVFVCLFTGVVGEASRCAHPDGGGADLHHGPEVQRQAQHRRRVGSGHQVCSGMGRVSNPSPSGVSNHSPS